MAPMPNFGPYMNGRIKPARTAQLASFISPKSTKNTAQFDPAYWTQLFYFSQSTPVWRFDAHMRMSDVFTVVFVKCILFAEINGLPRRPPGPKGPKKMAPKLWPLLRRGQCGAILMRVTVKAHPRSDFLIFLGFG